MDKLSCVRRGSWATITSSTPTCYGATTVEKSTARTVLISTSDAVHFAKEGPPDYQFGRRTGLVWQCQ